MVTRENTCMGTKCAWSLSPLLSCVPRFHLPAVEPHSSVGTVQDLSIGSRYFVSRLDHNFFRINDNHLDGIHLALTAIFALTMEW